MRTPTGAGVLLIAICGWSCRGGPDALQAPEAKAAAPVAPASASLPHFGTVAPATAGPTAPAAITGVVVETMDASGYTYLKLETQGAFTWAAIKRTKVAKGQTVTVSVEMALDAFESPTLKRTFDHILFGALATGERPADPDLAGAHRSLTAPADVGTIRVARVPGPEGRTVAEVHAQSAALAGKGVAVRGKVVKFLPGILGKNWLHLRDGSGTVDGKDNDLTVTTDAAVTVGDEIVVRGTVGKDKDFGAGYAYTVILESATIVK